MRKTSLAILVALSCAVSACGDRPASYEAPVDKSPALFGLDSKVGVLDKSDNRVVLLTPRAGLTLDRASVEIGKNFVRAEVSPDRKRLFVLSAGDAQRKRDTDERPSLTVIEGETARRFSLESPHSGFAIDPLGRWVALFAAPGTSTLPSTFVENPNEIVLVDLEALPEVAVTPRTLRSFGGRPQRVTFSDPLALPGGARRLLVVETDQDLALLDLDNLRAKPERPVITVRLTSGASAAQVKPAGIVIDDGEPGRADDARIGVRLAGLPNVVTLTLAPNDLGAPPEPNTTPNDFRPVPNLTDVGGTPEDIVFVRTDVGVRLAAIVPTTRAAVLVDPETSVTTKVDLPESYSHISIVTKIVGGAGGTDTTLLYGGSGSRGGIAFWSLGRATGEPYRSVEVVPLATSVDSVLDVPPPRPELKVLKSASANGFFVLNLMTRTAAPLETSATPTLHVSPDGQRLWVFKPDSPNLAALSLSDLHPVQLPLDRNINAVFDIENIDGGRALVAIDTRGAVGATVLDALAPDTAASHSYYGLLLEGLK